MLRISRLMLIPIIVIPFVFLACGKDRSKEIPKTTINENAPVSMAIETKIAAEPEIVWEIIANIKDWPSWNHDVKQVSMDGDLAKGTEFRWKSGRNTITSIIQGVERPRLLAWTGRTVGIKVIHVWHIEPQNGGTLVRTEESWEGFIVRIFRGSMQDELEKASNSGIMYLKTESERRAKP